MAKKIPSLEPLTAKSKIFKIAAIVLAFVLAAGIVSFIRQKYFEQSLASRANPKTFGNPKARVRIIEYSDFLCPACSQSAYRLKRFMDANPDKLFVTFRHYPIPQLHPQAVNAALYAECAAFQGKFPEFHDGVFSLWPVLSQKKDVSITLLGLAQELKLDLNALSACVKDKKTLEAVLGERAKGKSLGVEATPTFILNDKRLVGWKELSQELAVTFKEPSSAVVLPP